MLWSANTAYRRFQSVQYAGRPRVRTATAEAGHHLSKRVKRAVLIVLQEVEDSLALFPTLPICPGIPIRARSTRESHSSCALQRTKRNAGPAIPTCNQRFS